MKQYELWWADLPEPVGRPVLLLSRDQVYRILQKAIVAEISRPFVRSRSRSSWGTRRVSPALGFVFDIDRLKEP